MLHVSISLLVNDLNFQCNFCYVILPTIQVGKQSDLLQIDFCILNKFIPVFLNFKTTTSHSKVEFWMLELLSVLPHWWIQNDIVKLLPFSTFRNSNVFSYHCVSIFQDLKLNYRIWDCFFAWFYISKPCFIFSNCLLIFWK